MNPTDRLELQESERRLRLESSETTRRIQMCTSFASALEVVVNRSARVERRKALTRAKSEHLLGLHDSSLQARAQRRKEEASQSSYDDGGDRRQRNLASLQRTSTVERTGDEVGHRSAGLLEPLPVVARSSVSHDLPVTDGKTYGSTVRNVIPLLPRHTAPHPVASSNNDGAALTAVDWAVKHAEARSESIRVFLSRWRGTLGHHFAALTPPPTAAAKATGLLPSNTVSAMTSNVLPTGVVKAPYEGVESSPLVTNGQPQQQQYGSYPRLRNIARQHKTTRAVAAAGTNGVRSRSVSPTPHRKVLLPSLSPKRVSSPVNNRNPQALFSRGNQREPHDRQGQRKPPRLTDSVAASLPSITSADLVTAAILWIERNAEDVADAERLASQVINDVRRDANLVAVRQREAAEQRAKSKEFELLARRENARGVELARQRAAVTIRDIAVQSKVQRNAPESQLRWERLPSCIRDTGTTTFSVADAEKALHASIEASLLAKQASRRGELQKSVEGFTSLAQNSESALAEARQRAIELFKSSLIEYFSSRTAAEVSLASAGGGTSGAPTLPLPSSPHDLLHRALLGNASPLAALPPQDSCADGLPPYVSLNAIHGFDGSVPLLLTSTWLRSSSKFAQNGSSRTALPIPSGLNGSIPNNRKATLSRGVANSAHAQGNPELHHAAQSHSHHLAKNWIRVMLQQLQRSTLPAAGFASIIVQYHQRTHLGTEDGGSASKTCGSSGGDCSSSSSTLADAKNALVLRGPRRVTLWDIQLVMEYATEMGIPQLVVGPEVHLGRVASAALMELVLFTVARHIPRLDLVPNGVVCDPPEVEAEVRRLVRTLREVALHHRGVAIAKEKLANLGQVEAAEHLLVPALRRRAGTSLLWIVEHFCRGEQLTRVFLRRVEADMRSAVVLHCAAEKRKLDDWMASRQDLERWQTELSAEEARERTALENLADRNVVLITKEFVHLRQTVRRLSRSLHLSGWFSSMRRARQSFAGGGSSGKASSALDDEDGSLRHIAAAASGAAAAAGRRGSMAMVGGVASSVSGVIAVRSTVSPVSLSSDEESTPQVIAARQRDYDALAAAAAAAGAEEADVDKGRCNRAHDVDFGVMEASKIVLTPSVVAAVPGGDGKPVRIDNNHNNSTPPPPVHRKDDDAIPLVELPSGALTEFARTSELVDPDVRALHSSSTTSRQKAVVQFQSPPPSRQRM